MNNDNDDYGFNLKLQKEQLLHERLLNAGIDDKERHDRAIKMIHEKKEAFIKLTAAKTSAAVVPLSTGVIYPSLQKNVSFLRQTALKADKADKSNDYTKTLQLLAQKRSLVALENMQLKIAEVKKMSEVTEMK